MGFTMRSLVNIILVGCIVLMMVDMAWKNVSGKYFVSETKENISPDPIHGNLRVIESGINYKTNDQSGSPAVVSHPISTEPDKNNNKSVEPNVNQPSQDNGVVLVRPELEEITIVSNPLEDVNAELSEDEKKSKELESLIEDIFQKEVEIRKQGKPKPSKSTITTKPAESKPFSSAVSSPTSSTSKTSPSKPTVPTSSTNKEATVMSPAIIISEKTEYVPNPENPNEKIAKEKLISYNRPVWSDVRGYLGPPAVITTENMAKQSDRWQASLDMRGIPISGPHWLRIDLGRPCYISRMVIDWEEGYSVDYAIHGRLDPIECPTLPSQSTASSSSSGCMHPKDGWTKIIDTRDFRKSFSSVFDTITSYKHVVHQFDTIEVANTAGPSILSLDGNVRKQDLEGPYQVIKLLIRSPATKWGPSIWRWQIWGIEKDSKS